MKEWHKAMPLLRERRQLEAALGGPRNSLREDLSGQSRVAVEFGRLVDRLRRVIKIFLISRKEAIKGLSGCKFEISTIE